MPSILSANIPKYVLTPKPNFTEVGAKLDSILEEHFCGPWLAVRCISLQDHPGRTLDDMVKTIIELGTDRYDPNRKGVHDAMDKKFGIELHATPMIVKEKLFCPHYSNRLETGSVMGDFLSDCYGGAKIDRGYPLRIDIVSVYDLASLEPAPLVWKENGPEFATEPAAPESTTVFKFKNSNKKQDALFGIIKIL